MLGLRLLRHSFRAVKAWTLKEFDYKTPMGRNVIALYWPVVLLTPLNAVLQMYIYLEKRQAPSVKAFGEEGEGELS